MRKLVRGYGPTSRRGSRDRLGGRAQTRTRALSTICSQVRPLLLRISLGLGETSARQRPSGAREVAAPRHGSNLDCIVCGVRVISLLYRLSRFRVGYLTMSSMLESYGAVVLAARPTLRSERTPLAHSAARQSHPFCNHENETEQWFSTRYRQAHHSRSALAPSFRLSPYSGLHRSAKSFVPAIAQGSVLRWVWDVDLTDRLYHRAAIECLYEKQCFNPSLHDRLLRQRSKQGGLTMSLLKCLD